MEIGNPNGKPPSSWWPPRNPDDKPTSFLVAPPPPPGFTQNRNSRATELPHNFLSGMPASRSLPRLWHLRAACPGPEGLGPVGGSAHFGGGGGFLGSDWGSHEVNVLCIGSLKFLDLFHFCVLVLLVAIIQRLGDATLVDLDEPLPRIFIRGNRLPRSQEVRRDERIL